MICVSRHKHFLEILMKTKTYGVSSNPDQGWHLHCNFGIHVMGDMPEEER